jgi:hypothetical protein
VLQKEPKFVSPQAGRRIASPHSTPEDGTQLPQELVSREVPAGIVDTFKAVEVEKSDNVFRPSLGRPRESPSKPPLEFGSIDQAGQRIVGCAMG